MGDESGLAGTLLVVVIAWALAAVFMLTRTLVAAEQIDQRVGFITGQVQTAAEDLELIELAARTDDIARDIAAEAAPLDTQLATVVDIASNIETTAGSIRDTAGSIDETASGIRDTAGSILETAASINERVASIETTVGGIDARFEDILATVRSIACGEDLSTAPEPRRELAQQRHRCGDRGVPGINRRVAIVIELVRSVEADTTDVLRQVGRDHGVPTDATLHGHANSIDCRLNGEHCERTP